jgi:hypothetical protein
MRRWIALLSVVTATASSARAQEAVNGEMSVSRSAPEFLALIRAEALRVDATKNSKLFRALDDARLVEKLGLSPEQVGMVRCLRELTRDIFRAWLLRDLDAVPPPPPAVLAQRLSRQGDVVRDRLVAYAESMALEGILDPAQTGLWRGASGQRAQRLLAGRDGAIPNRVVDEATSAEALAEELESKANGNRRSGGVVTIVIGIPPIRKPLLVLPKEQDDLLRRLDNLTVAVIRAWLTRGLDAKSLPPRAVLARRFSLSDKVVGSLRTHAEAIAMEGILTPDQAERALASLWKLGGLRALKDPTLASRLRLSRSQREVIDALLGNRAMIPAELGYALTHTRNMPTDQAKLVVDNQVGTVEEAIWETLSASQARMLRRILDGGSGSRKDYRKPEPTRSPGTTGGEETGPRRGKGSERSSGEGRAE